jgi:peptidoglycan hydrolase-like protein with peptidoglycan-binding domain
MAYPTLKRGSTGEYVKLVQRELGITPDGIFGSQTEQAVRDFQRRKGLKVDGIVGAQTWRAMGHDPNGTFSRGGGSTSISSSGTLLDKVLGVFILYGIFQVLKRAL